jgi:DNA-binding CsgD family transcriptional regulator
MSNEIEPQSAEQQTTRRDGATPRRSEESLAPRPVVPVLNWKLVAWGGLIALLAVAASDMVSLWWLVLVFGLLVPVISALQNYWSAKRDAGPANRSQDKEKELLGALGELGELTPTTAAMRTTLTVEEAAGMLERLARRGHLEARTQGAVVLYGLWGPDRCGPDEVQTAPIDAGAGHGGGSADLPESAAPPAAGAAPPDDRKIARSSAPPLVEPLTEREKEVFELLASGRTNREIAADLFVTVGTIKAHTSNIYAKLQARNRAEALARARELGLLD